MYNTILKLRYRMIVNFVHEAGFLPSILVFLLAIGLLYIVTKLPDGCLAITAACMLFSIHLSRNDGEMLRILSPRLPKQVLIVDYYLAMLPFATASLCTGSVRNVSCCLLLPACLALVPPIHVDWKTPTHPLMRRGSIFYSGNFRMLFIPYLLLCSGAATGFLYNNTNLLIVCTLAFVFLLSNLQFRNLYLPHLFYYSNFRTLMSLNIGFSFINTAVLLAPFGLFYLASCHTLHGVAGIFACWGACSLFLMQTYLLRFTARTLSPLHLFILWALFVVCCSAILVPYIAALQMLIIAALAFTARERIKNIIR